MPKRPLTAYNIFFQEERNRVHARTLAQTGQKPTFKEVARSVANAWKTATLGFKAQYEALAAREKRRYALELVEYRTNSERATEGPGESTQNSCSHASTDAFSTSLPALQVCDQPSFESIEAARVHHQHQSTSRTENWKMTSPQFIETKTSVPKKIDSMPFPLHYAKCSPRRASDFFENKKTLSLGDAEPFWCDPVMPLPVFAGCDVLENFDEDDVDFLRQVLLWGYYNGKWLDSVYTNSLIQLDRCILINHWSIVNVA